MLATFAVGQDFRKNRAVAVPLRPASLPLQPTLGHDSPTDHYRWCMQQDGTAVADEGQTLRHVILESLPHCRPALAACPSAFARCTRAR